MRISAVDLYCVRIAVWMIWEDDTPLSIWLLLICGNVKRKKYFNVNNEFRDGILNGFKTVVYTVHDIEKISNWKWKR